MSKDSFTFLIIPKKNSSAKKFTLSGNLLKGVVSCMVIIVIASMYAYYDYISIKRDRIELERFRRQTKEQKLQISGLVEKVNDFSIKLEELSHLDKNIRMMANIDDSRYKGQILGTGGSINEETRIKPGVASDQRIIIAKVHHNIEQLTQDANEQKKSFHELLGFLKERRSIIAATPSVWPVQGWVTSEFGHRASPLGGAREFHRGIDIATRVGAPVAAPADGIIIEVAYDREMGNMIKIDHGHGMTTWYGHLSKSAVPQGSIIKRGYVIGYVGNSGRSTGSHLHYTVLLNNVPVNPRRYLN